VKLDYADAWVQVTLWLLTSGPALPHRVAIVYKQAATPLTAELDFTSWNLDVPVSDATFAFQLPAGHGPVEFGDFVAGLASRIMPSGWQGASPAASGAKPAGGGTFRLCRMAEFRRIAVFSVDPRDRLAVVAIRGRWTSRGNLTSRLNSEAIRDQDRPPGETLEAKTLLVSLPMALARTRL
jgi:hypothetical protein